MMKPEQMLEYIVSSDLRFKLLEALIEAPLTDKELAKKFTKNQKYKTELRNLEDKGYVVEVVRIVTKDRHKTHTDYVYDGRGVAVDYKVKVSKYTTTTSDHCFGLTEDGARIFVEVENMRKQAERLWSGYKK